jgi:hypothetical protein
MKKFILTDKSNSEKHEFKTLQAVVEFLEVDYHQARALLYLDKKVFVHKKVKELSKLYNLELINE